MPQAQQVLPLIRAPFRRVHCLLLCLYSLQARSIDPAIFIKGGTVVNSDGVTRADVLIQHGAISTVGPGLKVPTGATTLDASGKLVMPGGIDPHTHLDAPLFHGMTTAEDFHTGHRAALAGGTTFHIDFALPDRKTGSLIDGLDSYHQRASKGLMDYGFHMAIKQLDDQVAADMAQLVAKGVNSFKFFFGYKGALAVSDEVFLKGLLRCKELGALPMIHGENADAIEMAQKLTFEAGITGPEGHSLSRPAYIEGEGTGRAVRLARLVNTPLYVVHVMSKDALAEVQAGLAAGQRLFGEAVAGALALTDEPCWDPDFKRAAAHIISPPLRSLPHQAAVKRGLAGGLLHLVATDHCGWNSSQKENGRHDFRQIPNGIHGIEERLHVTWHTLVNTGLITPPDFVRLTSTAAAKIFNIFPRKGAVVPGADADLIIFDPAKEHTLGAKGHFSALDTSVYEGMRIQGQVETTISRGRIVFQHGQVLAEPGSSRFVELPPFAPAAFEGLSRRQASWVVEEFPYGPTPVKRAAAQKLSGRDEL